MSDSDRVRRIITATAAGIDAYTGGAMGTELAILQAASGLVHALGEALHHRSPPEIRAALLELGSRPVGHVSTSDDDLVDTAVAKKPQR